MIHKGQSKLLRIFSWLSLVRMPNVILLILAQYLASIYIFSIDLTLLEVLKDRKLFILVFASVCSIMSGYIINGLYDRKRDVINKPLKTKIETLIDQQSKLTMYFVLNFIVVVMSSYVSFRAVMFFVVYIFFIWLYSYALKRILILGNIISATLTIIPFFAILLYYKNFETLIFAHAFFLFLLILIREFVKDLENMSGDFVGDYNTIPIAFGETIAKVVIVINIVLVVLSAIGMAKWFDVGLMRFYFYCCSGLLICIIPLLIKSNEKKYYFICHNILRLVIVTGVISILLLGFRK